MAVIMIAEAPGADASFIHGCAAGVADTLVQAPGFVNTSAAPGAMGIASSRCGRSRKDHQAWYDDHVAPNLPPAIGPIPFKYIEMLLASTDS